MAAEAQEAVARLQGMCCVSQLVGGCGSPTRRWNRPEAPSWPSPLQQQRRCAWLCQQPHSDRHRCLAQQRSVVGYPGYTMGTEAPLPSRRVSLSGRGGSIAFKAASQVDCSKSWTELIFIKSKDAQTHLCDNVHLLVFLFFGSVSVSSIVG